MKFFHEFIHKFRLVDINSFQYILHVQPKFRRIRQIDFERMKLSDVHLECLKEIFAKIEFLRIIECKLDGNLHDSMLAMCPNLKRLTLFQTNVNDSNIIGDSNDWLHRKYPTLEQFQLNKSNRKFDGIGELKAFLELNPNIKKLQIHQRHMKGFEDLWMSANVQLDEFALVTASIDTNLCSLLNNLHASGFYKRLKLECICKISQDTVDQLAALKRLIELLSFFRMDSVELSALIDLEKLYIGRIRGIIDFHALPSTLKNLQAIRFYSASFDNIWPFVGQAPQLKRIAIEHLYVGKHFCSVTNVIDLVTLNKERNKVERACKLTIYVQEKIYLATKWALKDIDFKLIRLKRIESYNA